MSARLRATWLAAILFFAFLAVMAVQPTGYMTLSPGPTLDLLGSAGTSQLITAPGHKIYPDKGQLRMVTVYEQAQSQKLSLAAAIHDWLSDDTSVYPVTVWYPQGTSDSSNAQQSAAEMTSSIDLAKAAALTALHYRVDVSAGVLIADVAAGGPSSGKIKPGDVLIAVDATKVSTNAGAVQAIAKYHPGQEIPLTLMRGSKEIHVLIKSVPKGTSGAEAKQARVGVALGGLQVLKINLPMKIKINLPGNIGGDSAGMMFALTIYDLLTPGSLTDGHVIAGTGTIGSNDGTQLNLEAVGAIGGIDQKIRGAQRDGAQLFLAPASNCDEVTHAHYDSKTMKIVKVSTLQDAINAITWWTKNPNDPRLQGCS